MNEFFKNFVNIREEGDRTIIWKQPRIAFVFENGCNMADFPNRWKIANVKNVIEKS